MAQKSAGLVFYRFHHHFPEFLLVHPGGPFWMKKDLGVWSIPKGEFAETEDPLAAAIREVEEELGIRAAGEFMALSTIKQKGGKLVYSWALQQDIDPQKIKSNSFQLEWPPKSGTKKDFPEVDKAAWFGMEEAKKKIIPEQSALLEELAKKLS